MFAILGVPTMSRLWINSLMRDQGENTPKVWRDWVANGTYTALLSKQTTLIRSITDQFPTPEREAIITAIYDYFRDTPGAFEPFAARIFQISEPIRIIVDQITRCSADVGRDAVGKYQIGVDVDPVYV
jgi:hypothetical protein